MTSSIVLLYTIIVTEYSRFVKETMSYNHEFL